MNSIQLENLLLLDNEIKKNFIGIYPIDNMNELKQNNNLMIVNLDPSHKPGSHWVVLYRKDQDTVEYFDSLGNKPNQSIVKHLFNQNFTCIYSTKRIQNYNTNTCGLYCLFYSYYCCRSCTLQNIVNCFTNDLNKNETIVLQFAYIYLKSYL